METETIMLDKTKEIAAALRRNMVETGSLMCLGCGHSHNCGVSGCAIMRRGADAIDALTAQLAAVTAEKDAANRTLNKISGILNFASPDSAYICAKTNGRLYRIYCEIREYWNPRGQHGAGEGGK